MRIAALVLLAAQLLSAQKLLPIDDSARNPEFRSFVRKLQAVVAKRDAKGLKKLLDDDVIAHSEGKKDEKGWAAFRQYWKPEDGTSEVWETLADFCDLGFVALHPTVFVSPYVAWKFPRELDARNAFVVTRSNVPLRSAPERNAPVVATLEFDIVYAIGRAPDSWLHVRKGNDVEGFVLAQNLRSPLTPRGQFARKQGRWVITALER
jgi:Bacterial SH3 domain